MVQISLITSHIQGADAASIKYPNREEVVNNFMSQDGKKKIVLIFASWCIHCKDLLPEIEKAFFEKNDETEFTDIAKNNREIYDLTIISIDEDTSMLKEFVSSKLSKMDMVINVIRKEDLPLVISDVGITNIKTIPHIALFDRDKEGKIFKAYDGAVSAGQIRAAFL